MENARKLYTELDHLVAMDLGHGIWAQEPSSVGMVWEAA